MTFPTALVVFGAPRSGTSAFTGALGLLGCALPRDDLPITHHNPKGFFESFAFLRLFDDALASAGTSEIDWRQLPDAWFASDAAAGIVDRGSRMLAEAYGQADLLAFKNPRISRLYPLVEMMMAAGGFACRAVMIWRPAMEVAMSEADHHGLDLASGHLLWLRYVLDGERLSRGAPRSFVFYPSLLQDWRNVMADVERQTGARLSWSGTEAVDAFLDVTLRRNRVEDQGGSLSVSAFPWVAETSAALERLTLAPHDAEAIGKLDRIRPR